MVGLGCFATLWYCTGMTRGNYYIILVTGLATVFFSLFLFVLLLIRPEWAFPTIVLPEPREDEASIAVPDFVHIAHFEQRVITGNDEDGYAWTGIVEVQNDQLIPVPDAIITLQVVHSKGVEYHQFMTNAFGVAGFSVIIPTGSYRLEILDITGDNYRYQRKDDSVRTISGIAETIIIEE